ncbi:MAG: RHS repeat protein [Candidatus Omnitrophica bacterium]|nr:RHS repeat protein [Candidatus Omnitrophota bacterium]
MVDPVNRTTQFRHDSAGNLIEIIDPDNSKRQFGYDSRHRLIRQTDKRSFTTTYEYNFAGRVKQSNLPDGSTRQVSTIQSVGLSDIANEKGTGTDSACPLMFPLCSNNSRFYEDL